MAERLAETPLSKEQTLLQIRTDNRKDIIYERYINGEVLPPGSLAKILHLLPQSAKDDLRRQINTAQEAFWHEWSAFRCSPKGEGKPNFEDMISLMPAREEFRDFVNAQEGDLIVDLMGGSGTLAPYFMNNRPLGYIVVDRNPVVEEKAERQLSVLNFPLTDVVIADLSEGLPEVLSEHISSLKPSTVRYISNWGLTYLDAELFTKTAKYALSPNFNHGAAATLDINMITNGQFDPEELRKKFIREVIPRELKGLRFGRLKRAFPAMIKAREFAKNWPLVMPIWYPDEIQEIIQEAGLRVEKMDDSLLWEQSTAIRIIAS